MKILEYFHLHDVNQPLRIQRERRGRGRLFGWSLALLCWVPVGMLWVFLQQS